LIGWTVCLNGAAKGCIIARNLYLILWLMFTLERKESVVGINL
jgi:hypothetical protein